MDGKPVVLPERTVEFDGARIDQQFGRIEPQPCSGAHGPRAR
jgi:hypothetical protein